MTRSFVKNGCLALGLFGGLGLSFPHPAYAADCSADPINFNSHIAELVGGATIKAGKGCGFGLDGIGGAINETVITQKPKFGVAGVRGNTAIYMAKPGYQGPDEFTYVHIGTDAHGGPMKVSVRRKITVIP